MKKRTPTTIAGAYIAIILSLSLLILVWGIHSASSAGGGEFAGVGLVSALFIVVLLLLPSSAILLPILKYSRDLPDLQQLGALFLFAALINTYIVYRILKAIAGRNPSSKLDSAV